MRGGCAQYAIIAGLDRSVRCGGKGSFDNYWSSLESKPCSHWYENQGDYFFAACRLDWGSYYQRIVVDFSGCFWHIHTLIVFIYLLLRISSPAARHSFEHRRLRWRQPNLCPQLWRQQHPMIARLLHLLLLLLSRMVQHHNGTMASSHTLY